MKKLKMLTSILLTLVLCLGFVMPAFAVESNRESANYSITINNARDGHKYEAYQVFSADHTVKDGKNVLSNILWGSAIKKVADDEDKTVIYDYSSDLITELRKIDAFKTKFEALEAEEKTITAEEVIMVLDKSSDESDLVKEFSKIVGDVLVQKGQLENTTMHPDKTESGAYGTEVAEAYKISGLKPGYYVILDQEDNGLAAGDALSRYMVQVASNNTSVTVKSIQPTLTKTAVSDQIMNGETADTKNNTAKTGDAVEFKLESNVPDMTGYETFTFKVTDKLSKGFTFNADTLKVKIGDGEEAAPIKLADYNAKTDEEKKAFAIVYDVAIDETTKETTVAVDFKNMTEIEEGVNQGNAATKPVTLGDAIVITYNATLNNDAEQGINPNTNQAWLTYSNDPKAVGDGEKPTKDTPTEVTNTYSIGLGLTKFDKDDKETVKTKGLEGAEFLVYDGPEKKADGTDNTARNLLGIMVSEKAADGKPVIVTLNEVEKTIVEGKDVYSIKKDATGKAKEITLSEGTYYLKEIKAPDGFNLLKGELSVTLNATTTKTDNLTTVAWTVKIDNIDNNDADCINTAQQAAQTRTVDGKEIAYADLHIANKAGFQLPSTGGIGTVIFTVVGILVMAAVAVIAIKSNKKQ